MMTPYALISPAQVEPLHPAAIAGVEETEAAAAEVEAVAVEWSGADFNTVPALIMRTLNSSKVRPPPNRSLTTSRT